MRDIRNVMVPIDFSEPSRLALEYGVDVARVFRARLSLVHISNRNPYWKPRRKAKSQGWSPNAVKPRSSGLEDLLVSGRRR